MSATDAFDRCFTVTATLEGGLSTDPADPGNWTGGAVGAGECRGTKFGISAKAHPTLDIQALTIDQAKEIYRTDYWAPLHGDELPPLIAVLLFDAAVNCGPGTAVRWLQKVLSVPVDGIMGPETTAAVQEDDDLPFLGAVFLGQRLAALPDNPNFVRGWQVRLFRVALLANAN